MSDKTIWILSDGLAGHYNQSIGISNALQTRTPHEALIINIRLRHKLLRPLMRLIANHLPFLLGYKSLSFFYQHDNLPQKLPALIISAGGNTLFANITLSKATQKANAFSGTLKGYYSNKIAQVFTVTPLKNVTNNIVLDLPPANIDTAQNSSLIEPFYTLLVGGDGAGYVYSDEDWTQLAQAMTSIAKRDGITWKVTTSRRTGEAAEQILSSALPENCISEAIWFSSNPQKVVKRFLAEGQVIFCTEDSLTMVSEAIYAHKPTLTLQPKTMNPDSNDAQALDKYQAKKYIMRSPIAALNNISVEAELFCNSYPDIHGQIADALVGEIK